MCKSLKFTSIKFSFLSCKIGFLIKESCCKGQLISKCIFGAIVSNKIPTKFLEDFSIKRLHKKSKDILSFFNYSKNYSIRSFFDLARAEILKIISLVFWSKR